MNRWTQIFFIFQLGLSLNLSLASELKSIEIKFPITIRAVKSQTDQGRKYTVTETFKSDWRVHIDANGRVYASSNYSTVGAVGIYENANKTFFPNLMVLELSDLMKLLGLEPDELADGAPLKSNSHLVGISLWSYPKGYLYKTKFTDNDYLSLFITTGS